jgi:tryptophan synthase alpha subunit
LTVISPRLQEGCKHILLLAALPEEADAFVAEMREADVDTIFLAAPTSTDERLNLIGRSHPALCMSSRVPASPACAKARNKAVAPDVCKA